MRNVNLQNRLKFESLEKRALLAADLVAADFNADQSVDAADIDLLIDQVRSGGTAENLETYDLNDDGALSKLDVDYLVETLLDTRYGDIDLDGDVGFSDFLGMSDNFGKPGTWADGNFDATDEVAFDDFLLMSENFGYRSSDLVYTHLAADGNRYVPGWGDISNSSPIDIPLDFVPDWVLGIQNNNDGERHDIWIATSDQGQQQVVIVDEDGAVTMGMDVEPLQPGVPPALFYENGYQVSLAGADLDRNAQDSSVPSHPVLNESNTQTAFIDADGNVVVQRTDGESASIDVNALLDSRILSDGAGRLLVLSDPTTLYPHGIFGDRIEASSFSIIDTNVTPAEVNKIFVPEGRVIESLIPTWIDVDNDDELEIIVTVSNSTNGAQIVIYNEQGEVERAGEGIGRAFRWRHQLAIAPFGLNGEMEFVDVLTPHIGGVVEFRSLDQKDAEGNDLPIITSVPGYTSHVNRTRNIDMAAAGDFDGDSIVELLLPDQRRTSLGAITRTESGAEVDWSVPIGGTLTTNVGVLQTREGRLFVAVGRSDGVLRIWRS